MSIKSSIKNKLVSYFSIILVVGLLVSIVVSNQICKSIIETDAMKHLEGVALETADKVNLILNQKVQQLQQISSIPDIMDADVQMDQKMTIIKYLNTIFEFKDIAFIDLQGNPYSIAGTVENIIDSISFKEVLEGKQNFSETLMVEGKMTFAIKMPVMDRQGKVIGGLIALENIDIFSSVLESSTIVDEYMMLDTKGRIIAHSDEKILYEQMAMDEMPSHDEFNEVYEVYQTMLQGQQGVRLCKKPETGEENYLSYAPTHIGWSIALVQKQSHVLGVLGSLNVKLMGMMVILAVVGIMAVHYVAKSFANHVSEIAHCIDDVASGDFNRPVPEELLERKDEVGDVARALSTMKKELEEMLSTIRNCTDYMNEQMEDLTSDIKESIKNTFVLEKHQLDEEQQEEVVHRLQVLNQIDEIFSDFGSIIRKKLNNK